MSARKFRVIFLPVTAVLLATAIAVTCVMEYWSTVMDAVFGSAQVSTIPAEGTEDWDTDYYDLNAEGMTQEQTAIDGQEVARRAEAEGIVLLKNQNNALPLTAGGAALSDSNTLTVNAMGWSFYYPSLGGSGSGAVSSNDLVSPTQALEAANILVNQGLADYYMDWSQAHYTDWQITKANGYYTDDDTNTEPARPTVGKTYDAAWDVPELNGDEIAQACEESGAAANNVQILWIGPGASETVTITVDQEDIASYDDQVNKCYVLDAGDYTFYLGTVDGTVYGSHSWAYATPADSKALTGADNAVTFAKADGVSDTINCTAGPGKVVKAAQSGRNISSGMKESERK